MIQSPSLSLNEARSSLNILPSKPLIKLVKAKRSFSFTVVPGTGLSKKEVRILIEDALDGLDFKVKSFVSL